MNPNNRLFPIIIMFVAFLLTGFKARAAIAPLKLPYEKGQEFMVVQGYHSLPTHIKKDAFALDFSQNGCDAYGKAAVATSPGKVMFMSEGGYNGGYGTEVIIDHGNHMVSRYAHLIPGSIPTIPGAAVKGGQIIGRIGDTGLVAGLACPSHPGTHLHFAMDTVQPDGTFLAYDPEPLSGYKNIREGMWYLSDNDARPPGIVLGVSTTTASTTIISTATAPVAPATDTGAVAAPVVTTTTVAANTSDTTHIIPSGSVTVILPPASPITFVPAVETPITTSTLPASSTVSSTPPVSSTSTLLTPTSSLTSSSSITAPSGISFQFDELGMNITLSFGSSTDTIRPDDALHYEMDYSTSTSLSEDDWQFVSSIPVSIGNTYLIGMRTEDDHGNISDVATATWDFPEGFIPYIKSKVTGDARQYFTVQTTSTLSAIDIFTTDFTTSAKDPDAAVCSLSLFYDRFIPPIPADNAFGGYGCDGDLRYSFASSSITLSPGRQYQWIFKADTGNTTSGAGVRFYGTMADTAGGPFSDPSIKNAKFTVTGNAGVLFSN